jgi:hypothetical protein
MTDENQFRRVQWDGDEPLPNDDDGPDGMPLRPPGAGLSAEDLQLLTLAARALGATVETVEGEQWVALHFADGTIEHGWNPLRHRDDTFNLACDCGIDLHFGGDFVRANGMESEEEEEFERGNKVACRAAAARAIVRAAAEIGKAMA